MCSIVGILGAQPVAPLMLDALRRLEYRGYAFSAALKRFIRESDLPPVRFHDLRHSRATQLLREGIHPKVVSERLGHSKIGATLDIYSHVMPGMQEEAARCVDAALRSALEQPRPDASKPGREFA